MKNNIAVITDNTFVNEKLYKQYNNLKYIELLITIPDDLDINIDELSNDDYCEILNKYEIKTSQPSIGFVTNKWDELLKKYDFLIVAGISKKISGTYNTQYQLAQEDKYKDRVIVLDTLAMSGVLEKMIIQILEYLKKEKINNKKQIEDELNIIINNIQKDYKCILFPKTLDILARSGRISKLKYTLTNILKIYPILEFDKGEINKYGVMLNYSKGVIKEIIKLKKILSTDYIEIGYSKFDSINFITELKNSIYNLGFKIIEEIKIPKVILTHWGKNFLIINFWKNKKCN